MKSQKAGYIFAFLAFTIFACQDALSKHLAGAYHPLLITMIRYWAFAAFAILLASRSPSGLRGVISSRHPWLQILRGILLATQIVMAIICFKYAGMIHSQAIFAAAPLFVAILSVPVLGEKVGWRRWAAIGIGFCGVLIMLSPEASVFSPILLLPLGNAIMAAFYSVITRLTGREDAPLTSFLYISLVGFAASSMVGPFFWSPIAQADFLSMGLLCVTGIASHYCLIKAFDHLDAVLVQPISYFQLVVASALGIMVFGETLETNILIGALVVVGAGLFTIWREAVKRRKTASLSQADSR